VRRAFIFAGVALLIYVCGAAWLPGAAAQTGQGQTQKPAQQSSSPQVSSQPALQTSPPAQAAGTLRTIVLDPGHGGEDTGARGPAGVAEKNIVLEFAETVASSLRAEGFQVIMTRVGDTDPSLDDRDAIANAQTGAIFVSLHVGSTGAVGSARTYTYLFPTAAQTSSGEAQSGGAVGSPPPAEVPSGFLLWRAAQQLFVAQSVKLGDLIQVQLAQKFKGSPEVSSSAPVAVLRSVAAPAVAVEISSIATDQQKLEVMGTDLAFCIARAVADFKTIYLPGNE
jgi:N-acetylmuramoyl-L-alanine amidase